MLYNFTAFALQMPLGIWLDGINRKATDHSKAALYFTYAGILLTIAGSFLSGIIAGLGNAFFHTGAGVLTIQQDRENQYEGRGLGVFVAPGAFGVTAGILYADTSAFTRIQILISLVMLVIMAVLYLSRDLFAYQKKQTAKENSPKELILGACLAAVILRSVGGTSIAFGWKSGMPVLFLTTACIAIGKAAGGFAAARFGSRRTAVYSLLIASVCFGLGNQIFFGMAALLFFNMSMPLTLKLSADTIPDEPGFAFGILTFGLFLGWLPAYCGWLRSVSPLPHGIWISLVTLCMLYFAYQKAECR